MRIKDVPQDIAIEPMVRWTAMQNVKTCVRSEIEVQQCKGKGKIRSCLCPVFSRLLEKRVTGVWLVGDNKDDVRL